MSTELNQLLDNSTGFVELNDTQMDAIGGGSKKRGSTTIVNNNPIVANPFDEHYSGGPILNFPTIIADDGGR